MVVTRGVDTLEHQINQYFAKVVYRALIRIENQRSANLFIFESTRPAHEQEKRDSEEYEKSEEFFHHSIKEINTLLDDLPIPLHTKIIKRLMHLVLENKPSLMNSVTSDLVDNHWRPDPDNQKDITKLPPPSMDQPGGLYSPEYVQAYITNQATGRDDPPVPLPFVGQGSRLGGTVEYEEQRLSAIKETENSAEDKASRLHGVLDSVIRYNSFQHEAQTWDLVKQDPSLRDILYALKSRKTPTLRSTLSVICKESSINVDLSPLADLGRVEDSPRDHFSTILIKLIPKMSYLRELDVQNRHAGLNLPMIENRHVKLIGTHCRNLEFLNLSFHKSINKEGFVYLGEVKDSEVETGCFKLVKLYIYDTSVFEKEVAKLVVQLPNLKFLGYKETGKVIKTLNKYPTCINLNLTHIDNRGSKARRLDYSALRCKKTITNAMVNVCPNVSNLKLRVSDDDVAGLIRLDQVATVELVYHVGTIQSPGIGTHYFMQVRGTYLTSLALTCQNMSVITLKAIAEYCVKLQMLWYRSNHFTPNSQDELPEKHNYLTNLHTLYLRIGNNELYIVQNFPDDVLPFLTRNAPLRELIVAVRSPVITNTFVKKLLKKPNFSEIEKILLLIPGVNSIKSTLKLHDETLEYIINNCKKIKKIGNLLSWSLSDESKADLKAKALEQRWDIEIIDKKMILR